jgi:hypothetical protein
VIPPTSRLNSGGKKKEMVDRVYSKTFHKAAELLGDRKALARELRVPLADLERWIAGTTKPPLQMFLKAIDLVLDETAPQGGLSEPSDGAPPHDSSPGGHSSLML